MNIPVMKSAFAMLFLLASGVASGAGRTISVSRCNLERGRVTSVDLNFSSADTGSHLYVVWGPADVGEDPGLWPHSSYLGMIPGDRMSEHVDLPFDDIAAFRFFLCSDDGKYEKEFSYVQATGSQYVLLGGSELGTQITIDGEVSADSGDSMTFWGTRDSQGGYDPNRICKFVFTGMGSKFRFDYRNANNENLGSYEVGRRFSARTSRNGLVINGETVFDLSSTPYNDFTFAGSLALFALNTEGTINSYAKAKLYSFKLYQSRTVFDDTTLKYDLVPCEKDGVVGLYNRVDGEFFSSESSTSLVAGEAVINTTQTVEDFSAPLFSHGQDRKLSGIELGKRDRRIAVTAAVTPSAADVSLVAAYGPVDCGESLRDWPNALSLAVVPAATESVQCTLPVNWGDDVQAVRLFLMPRCGKDYDTAFSYVQATGSQYVLLGGSELGTQITIDGEVCADSGDSMTFWGTRDYSPGGQNRKFVFTGMGSKFRFDYRNANNENLGSYEVGRRFSARTSRNGLVINGETVFDLSSTPYNDFTFAGSLALFALNTEGTINSYAKAKLYSFKLYQSRTVFDDTTLKYDLVPCEKDGVVGLYNKVDGAFFSSESSTPLVAGPAIPDPLADTFFASECLTKPERGLMMLFR